MESKQYEQRVICFFDILGFKNHIDKTKTHIHYLEKLFNIFDTIDNFEKHTKEKTTIHENDLQITQFSDSVVLSYKIESKDQLAQIIMSLGKLLIDLVQYDILIRGAITMGELIHTPTRLFGPAMNEVYELESKIAIYPRVIIARDVLRYKESTSELKDISEQVIMEWIKVDCDGWHYLNYFYGIRVVKYIDAYSFENYFKYLERINVMIKEHLDENYLIKAKYGWLNRRLNSALDVLSQYDFSTYEKDKLDKLLVCIKQNAGKLYSNILVQ